MAGGIAGAGNLYATPSDMDRILATIRTRESKGNYLAPPNQGTASGAYQFIRSTWNNYGGYSDAYKAPAAIQDAYARAKVQSILDRNGGQLAAVPVSWYLGHVPTTGSPEWTQVPKPEYGNTITPLQYTQDWLAAYQKIQRAGITVVSNTGIASGQPQPVSQPGQEGITYDGYDLANAAALGVPRKVAGFFGGLTSGIGGDVGRIVIGGVALMFGLGLVLVGATKSTRDKANEQLQQAGPALAAVA